MDYGIKRLKAMCTGLALSSIIPGAALNAINFLVSLALEILQQEDYWEQNKSRALNNKG